MKPVFQRMSKTFQKINSFLRQFWDPKHVTSYVPAVTRISKLIFFFCPALFYFSKNFRLSTTKLQYFLHFLTFSNLFLHAVGILNLFLRNFFAKGEDHLANWKIVMLNYFITIFVAIIYGICHTNVLRKEVVFLLNSCFWAEKDCQEMGEC